MALRTDIGLLLCQRLLLSSWQFVTVGLTYKLTVSYMCWLKLLAVQTNALKLELLLTYSHRKTVSGDKERYILFPCLLRKKSVYLALQNSVNMSASHNGVLS